MNTHIVARHIQFGLLAGKVKLVTFRFGDEIGATGRRSVLGEKVVGFVQDDYQARVSIDDLVQHIGYIVY